MTKLYFHAANTGDTGTLPTTIQCALGTPTSSADAATVNRSMNTTIGVSQASLALTTTTTNPGKLYFTRFCSSPMSVTSIAADTWTFSFAASQSSTSNKFPYNTSATATYICLYVWRPSNGTKIATILDADTGSNNTTSSTGEIAFSATFAGATVNFASQDILCFECYFDITWSRISGTGTFFYDGTTEADGTSNAAFLNTPNNTITFGAGGGTVANPAFFTTKLPDPRMLQPMFAKSPLMVVTPLERYRRYLRTINKRRILPPYNVQKNLFDSNLGNGLRSSSNYSNTRECPM